MIDVVSEFISRQEAAGMLPPGAGVAAAIVDNGQVVLTHTSGFWARDGSLPVTPNTRFEIGSLTKAFTGAALVLARESGSIDLERPINSENKVLPLSDPVAESSASVTDILCHRTGMTGSRSALVFPAG